MKVCPECETPQTSSSPFCENCGYRLRSADTALEGLPAISPEMLKASKLRRPERVATAENLEAIEAEPPPQEEEEAAVPPSFKQSFERGRRETDLETPALTAQMLMEHRAKNSRETAEEAPASRAAERAPHSSSRTVMEGMEAVSRASRKTPAPGKTPAVERSGTLSSEAISRAPDRKNMVIFTIIGTIIGLAVGFGAGSFSSSRSAQGKLAASPASPRKVAIPAGTYTRGLNDEKRSVMIQTCYKVDEDPDNNCDQEKLLDGEFPESRVDVPAYKIDATEVTVGQYSECVEAGKCEEIDTKKCKVYTNLGLQISLRVPKALLHEDIPVTCLTRAQAAAFCAYMGGDLPTHDQWERAGRGDEDTRLFPWGDTWSSTVANWGELDVIKSSIVGKVDGVEWVAPPGLFGEGDSPFGLHDMAGNVSEWVRADGERQARGSARGGSWTSDPFGLRVTGRLSLDPRQGRTDVGMRCVYP